MSPQTAAPIASELFQPSVQMWQSAAQVGLRLQEESACQLADMLTKFGPPQKWRQQVGTICAEAIRTAEQNVEEAVRVVKESDRRNVNVLQKAIEAGHAKSADESQAKVREVCQDTLNAIQASAQAVVQANTRILKSWAELGKKVTETMAGGRLG